MRGRVHGGGRGKRKKGLWTRPGGLPRRQAWRRRGARPGGRARGAGGGVVCQHYPSADKDRFSAAFSEPKKPVTTPQSRTAVAASPQLRCRAVSQPGDMKLAPAPETSLPAETSLSVRSTASDVSARLAPAHASTQTHTRLVARHRSRHESSERRRGHGGEVYSTAGLQQPTHMCACAARAARACSWQAAAPGRARVARSSMRHGTATLAAHRRLLNLRGAATVCALPKQPVRVMLSTAGTAACGGHLSLLVPCRAPSRRHRGAALSVLGAASSDGPVEEVASAFMPRRAVCFRR